MTTKQLAAHTQGLGIGIVLGLGIAPFTNWMGYLGASILLIVSYWLDKSD